MDLFMPSWSANKRVAVFQRSKFAPVFVFIWRRQKRRKRHNCNEEPNRALAVVLVAPGHPHISVGRPRRPYSTCHDWPTSPYGRRLRKDILSRRRFFARHKANRRAAIEDVVEADPAGGSRRRPHGRADHVGRCFGPFAREVNDTHCLQVVTNVMVSWSVLIAG